MTQLSQVSKPYQYTGGEYGIADVNKLHDTKFCMCVSDSYDIGMSNLGVKILYYLFNSLEGVVCERCYAPWQDYVDYLNSNNLKLASLESKTPLSEFNFIGFSMQYEMCYSNMFYMLELAGIPMTTEERGENFPFIVAGGPCAVNLEPLYKYLDFVFVGEGETIWPDIIADWRKLGMTKAQFLQYINDKYECIYVPSLTEVTYNGDKVESITGKQVKRNIIADMDSVFAPMSQMVPNIEMIHDRAVIELFRGCANGCRFCQAGFIYRPVRQRSAETVMKMATNLIESTGYDELSLNSLSTSDYSHLGELLGELHPYCKQNNVQLNLPSLRLDSFSSEYVAGNRLSSLTFAPEAGTQRLRDVINKNITEDNIYNTIIQAFEFGYSSVKLYFMMGLPTETMEDIEGIITIACRIKALYKKHKKSNKQLRLSVSCATFIPKPFTPFQWEAFADRETVVAKQQHLYTTLRSKGISFSYTDYDVSLLEAILARGGRNVADSMLDAYRNGAKFDAWSEHFNYEFYRDAFEKNGVNVEGIINGFGIDEVLPWDYVSVGVDKSFLLKQRELAYGNTTSPTCNMQCSGCGINKLGYCRDSHGNKGAKC